MADIVDRLSAAAAWDTGTAELLDDAVAEIERLRTENERLSGCKEQWLLAEAEINRLNERWENRPLHCPTCDGDHL